MVKVVRLIKCKGLPILKQLQIEEALLRKSGDNWCLLNDGSSQPAIVMGISGYTATSSSHHISQITFTGRPCAKVSLQSHSSESSPML